MDENGVKRPLTPPPPEVALPERHPDLPSEIRRRQREEREREKERKRAPFHAKCDLCLFENDKRWVYEKHAEHHEKRYNLNVPVNCPDCGELFPTKHGLNPHYQERHDPEKGVCIECLKVMPAKDVHRHLDYVHYTRALNVFCPICNKPFRRRGELEVHK